MAKKMWAGRFEKATDKEVNDYNSSLPFDCKMYSQDIEGSIAHSQMLAKQGVISDKDAEDMIAIVRRTYGKEGTNKLSEEDLDLICNYIREHY